MVCLGNKDTVTIAYNIRRTLHKKISSNSFPFVKLQNNIFFFQIILQTVIKNTCAQIIKITIANCFRNFIFLLSKYFYLIHDMIKRWINKIGGNTVKP